MSDKITMTVEELRNAVIVYNALIADGYNLESDEYDCETVEYDFLNQDFIITTSIDSRGIFVDYRELKKKQENESR